MAMAAASAGSEARQIRMRLSQKRTKLTTPAILTIVAQTAPTDERPQAGFSRLCLLVVGLSLASCSTITEFGDGDEGSTSDASTSTTGSVLPSSTDPESTSTSGLDTGSDSGSSTAELDCSSASFLRPACPSDVPQVEMCNVWNDDCPQGEKCNIWSTDASHHWDATRCVPLAPDPAGPGEPCTAEGTGVSGFDDCGVSSVCLVSDSETLQGECMPMCTGSENAPVCDDPNRECVAWSESIPAFCIEHCDPLDVASCPDGEACYPTGISTFCIPDASGPDMGAAFDPCEFINACDPGLACVSATAVGACPEDTAQCCTPLCDLSAPDCPEAMACVPVYEPSQTPPGQEDVGFCGQEPMKSRVKD